MEQNETKQFVCTGNCIGCSVSQRAFCASQHSYRAMRMLQGMGVKFEDLERRFIALSDKIEAITNNEALIFEPSESTSSELSALEDTAQEGDGADNRLPNNNSLKN